MGRGLDGVTQILQDVVIDAVRLGFKTGGGLGSKFANSSIQAELHPQPGRSSVHGGASRGITIESDHPASSPQEAAVSLVIGVPKEHRPNEFRVGMIPAGVDILRRRGHQVYVERGAGIGSGFTDEEYEAAGARIAYGPDEAFRRADVLIKVERPTEEEVAWMAEGQIMLAQMMLATARSNRAQALQARKATCIAYELIEEDDGTFPVLYPLSQIAGRMCAQIAAQYLQNNQGGNGILMGGIAGIPPAEVVIIGAGVVGLSAVAAFLGTGARIILMDRDLGKLQAAHERFQGGVTTMVSHDFNLERVCKFADVLVSAIQVPGLRAPQIISREMVASMRPGSVIIDMSINQGGSVETIRPTRHDDPVYVAEGVIHYAVPNVPGVVARTATHAFLNAAWPYILQIVDEGVVAAVEKSAALKRGLIMQNGALTRAW